MSSVGTFCMLFYVDDQAELWGILPKLFAYYFRHKHNLTMEASKFCSCIKWMAFERIN